MPGNFAPIWKEVGPIGPDVPELARLSLVEERLIAIVAPIVSVFTNVKLGGWAYKGHVTNIRQDVSQWIKRLPRNPKEAPIVFVRRRTQGGLLRGRARPGYKVRPGAIFAALTKLKTLQAKIPTSEISYGDIEIDMSVFGLEPFSNDLEKEVEPDLPFFEPEIEEPALVKVGGALASYYLQQELPQAIALRKILTSSDEQGSSDKPPNPWDTLRRMISNISEDAYESLQETDEPLLISPKDSRNLPEIPLQWIALLLRLPTTGTTLPSCDMPTMEELCCDLAEELEVCRETAGDVFADAQPEQEYTCGTETTDNKNRCENMVDDLLSRLGGSGSTTKEAKDVSEDGGANDQDADDEAALEKKFPWAAGRHEVLGATPRDNQVRVDPPEVRAVVNDGTPGYARGAFPKVFPHGTADPTLRDVRVPLLHYCAHLMQASSRAQVHPTFRYWAWNTYVRSESFSGSPGFRLKNASKAVELTDELKRGDKKRIMKLVESATREIPGTKGHADGMTRSLQSMIDQLEAETTPESGGNGQVPCLWQTRSSAFVRSAILYELIQKWRGEKVPSDPLVAHIYELQATYPLVTAWYAALRLELLFHLDTTVGRPMYATSEEGVAAVHEAFGKFECASNGVAHLHCIRWMPGNQKLDALTTMGGDDDSDSETELEADVARKACEFFEQWVCEWLPDATSQDMVGPREKERQEAGVKCSEDPLAQTPDQMVCKLLGASNEDCEKMVCDIAREVQIHDNHQPEALGPPTAGQPCCKYVAGTEGTDAPITYCGKCFPMSPMPPYAASICEDEHRKGILHLRLPRNTYLMNAFNPVRLLCSQSNVDDTPILTLEAVKRYLAKYATKNEQGAATCLGDFVRQFDDCLTAATKQNKGMLSCCFKYYNKLVAARTMSQNELCHHLLRLPSFLATRSFKNVTMEPKTRAINTAATKTDEILMMDVYDKYLARATSTPGSNLTHPTSGHTYTPGKDWEPFLTSLSWYQWTMFMSVRGGRTQFEARPKICVISPYLDFYKAVDENRKSEFHKTIRLALKFYCNIELTDVKDDDLEVTMNDFCRRPHHRRTTLKGKGACPCPAHVRKRWRNAQRSNRKRDEADAEEADDAEEAGGAGGEPGEQLKADLGDDALGNDVSKDTEAQEEERRRCEELWSRLQVI